MADKEENNKPTPAGMQLLNEIKGLHESIQDLIVVVEANTKAQLDVYKVNSNLYDNFLRWIKSRNNLDTIIGGAAKIMKNLRRKH